MKNKTQQKSIGMLFYLITIIAVLVYTDKRDQYNLEKHKNLVDDIIKLSYQNGSLTYRNILLDYLHANDSVSITEVDSLCQVYLEKGGKE